MAWKIALAGIFHESNTFLSTHTTLEDFKKGHWLKGEAIRKEYQSAYHEIGGMLEVMDKEEIEVLPIMFAEATPGGIISNDTYALLLRELMMGLQAAGPVDGCLVVPHGAAVSDEFRDMDGHWLSMLRARLGNHIPIVGTLDPHANLSQQMVTSTDALIAYKTNPHVDQRETGKEAARLMVDMLKGRHRPVQILFQLPLAINIERQGTKNEPCRSLYAYAASLVEYRSLISVSILLGFPYADVEDMGASVLVISDGDHAAANATGKQLVDFILDRRQDFKGRKEDIDVLFLSLREREPPILLLDMGDNVGAGAPGNSSWLLSEIEKRGNLRYFACIHDPLVVREAREYNAGECFDIEINENKAASERYRSGVRLIRLANGKFTETAARHGGQAHFDMGSIAIVGTRNGSIIMFTTLRIPPFSLRQLTDFGIDPAGFDVIVAKGVHAPIAAYGPVCRTMIQVDSPGFTQSDMTRFPFRHRRKPLFPFEEEDK